MDERRAINQATISDHGGAAACTGLQKPLAGFTEATRHGTMKANSNSVDLFTISPSASEEQHADVIDLDKMMVLHVEGFLRPPGHGSVAGVPSCAPACGSSC